jgi:hypothetical protein
MVRLDIRSPTRATLGNFSSGIKINRVDLYQCYDNLHTGKSPSFISSDLGMCERLLLCKWGSRGAYTAERIVSQDHNILRKTGGVNMWELRGFPHTLWQGFF